MLTFPDDQKVMIVSNIQIELSELKNRLFLIFEQKLKKSVIGVLKAPFLWFYPLIQ